MVSLDGYSRFDTRGLTAAYTGIALGMNLTNALVVGVLGLPGFVLLLLLQWVL